MPEEAIRGNQKQSYAIRGYQRQSEAIRCQKKQSEFLRGNQRQSEAIRGSHMQSAQAIRGNHRRQSSLAIIVGNHRRQPSAHECGLWSTSSWSQASGRAAPWGGRRPSHALVRSPADSRAPSSCACRWRRLGRMDGAVVGVWVAPSAVSMRASGLTCGERAVAPWWSRACKAGGASGLTENLLCRQMPPKDATFPSMGVSSL